MIDKNQMNRVRLANQLPLNRIAMKWLDEIYPEAPGQSELAVLTLMRWGLDNHLQLQPRAPHHPDWEQLMRQVNLMSEWEPRDAMEFLTNPEGGENEEVFSPHDLVEQPTAEDAAEFLLENLYNTMVATAP